jgi:hypothetical protein
VLAFAKNRRVLCCFCVLLLLLLQEKSKPKWKILLEQVNMNNHAESSAHVFFGYFVVVVTALVFANTAY